MWHDTEQKGIRMVVPKVSVVLVAVVTGLAVADASAAEKSLAENIFSTSDKDENEALDEEEFRKARSLLRAALDRSVRGLGFGGNFAAHVAALANGAPDADRDGKVTPKELEAFVKDIGTKRDEMVKKAQKIAAEERAKAKKRQAELEQKRREAQKRHQQSQNKKKKNKKRR